MALTPADQEWIRRLGIEPTAEDRATLRAMRRGATSPDEVRLLDSLLKPIRHTSARHQMASELEQRLAVINDALSEQGQERANAAVRRGALRIVGHRASAARRYPLESDQEDAIKAAMTDSRERRRAMEEERSEIKARLREMRKAERAAVAG